VKIKVWNGEAWSVDWLDLGKGNETDAAIAVFPDGSNMTVPTLLFGDVFEKGYIKVCRLSYFRS
jgi:hypothetical protein